jgi:hypothetical protein
MGDYRAVSDDVAYLMKKNPNVDAALMEYGYHYRDHNGTIKNLFLPGHDEMQEYLDRYVEAELRDTISKSTFMNRLAFDSHGKQESEKIKPETLLSLWNLDGGKFLYMSSKLRRICFDSLDHAYLTSTDWFMDKPLSIEELCILHDMTINALAWDVATVREMIFLVLRDRTFWKHRDAYRGTAQQRARELTTWQAYAKPDEALTWMLWSQHDTPGASLTMGEPDHPLVTDHHFDEARPYIDRGIKDFDVILNALENDIDVELAYSFIADELTS